MRRTNTILLRFQRKAIARAETSGSLKFAVRLWEAKGELVVEVQRTSGCCFLYQQTAKAVMQAAKFGSAPAKAARSLPIPRSIPRLPDMEWESSTVEGIQLACETLKEDNRLDAHVFAIESLVQISEASKCRAFCARNILSADSELLSTLLSLIQCSRMEDAEELSTSTAQERVRMMHRHALTILANCLAFMHESGGLPTALQDLPELTCDATLSALVQAVAIANSEPHDAAAACRCLQALCQGSEIKQRVVQLGASRHVSAAQRCRHVILQDECTRLMRDLL